MLILSITLVLINRVHCSDIPQLEVLFHSSDPDIVWKPDDRLGHNQQLAKHHPRQKVDVAYKKGFPSAADFYSNFVERHKPVIFNEAVSGKDYEHLRLVNLNHSSRAALSYVDVSSFTSPDKQQESLW